jgi:hypothetical protein
MTPSQTRPSSTRRLPHPAHLPAAWRRRPGLAQRQQCQNATVMTQPSPIPPTATPDAVGERDADPVGASAAASFGIDIRFHRDAWKVP